MAFFATSPISMMMPMRLIRFSVPPVASSASTTPISDSGSESITGSGAVNEPNCITSTRYISAMPMTSADDHLARTLPPGRARRRPARPRSRAGNSIFAAIFIASAVTSPGERPCTLADTVIVRLPSKCWICAGPLSIVMVAIWSSGTIMLVPPTAIGRCSMLEASTRSSGCRRTATSRDSPVGSTQSPTSTPAKATRSACAASPTEMPSWHWPGRGPARCCSSSLGSCSDRPTSTAPGISVICSMKSLVISIRRRESGPVELDLHRLLRTPLFRSSSTDVLGADQALEQARAARAAISNAERLRSVLLPMST